MLKRSSCAVRLSSLSVSLLIASLSTAWLSRAIADDTSDCEAVNGVTPICGFQSPEDLEVMAGDHLLIVSEYGGLSGKKPGALSSYHTIDETVVRLFPGADSTVNGPSSENSMWGDKNCPGPPSAAFDPHGIHHSADLAPERLLVVNHGGRESIEIFEVKLDAGGDNVALTWRGCIIAAPGTWLNDVVTLPNGGFAATNMMPRDFTREQIFAVEASKADSGYVLEWQVDSGWRKLPGTEGALTNGIEVSPDGKVLYINYYLGSQVAAVERETGKRLWTIEVEGPDNTTWAPDGKLLVATHQHTTLRDILKCSDADIEFCPIAYEIMAVDPATGSHSLRYQGGGAPMAAATVGVQIGQTLYLGSFAGQRIGRVELSP
ncbi:MAG: hypothetical protein ACI915_003035 [Gammaproteobacteria bacterium]|jgi:hypothetical protein